SANDESRSAPAFTEAATPGIDLALLASCRRLDPFVILSNGGAALVRRRIQTPSDATVLSVVQPEGEVVLGASPLARHLGVCRCYPSGSFRVVGGGPIGI